MKAFLQLLRSMRFAIAILTVVAVAATIGSVLEQSQPQAVYINRYGEFWTTFFALCGLNDVYHAPWFFLLLAFMATSTALCLWQNTPAMLRDMRSFREQRSLASLRTLEHSIELDLPVADPQLRGRLASYLTASGFRFKAVESGQDYMLAARTGNLRRLGYLLIHGAMVLICIGGLIDGNFGLRLRIWSGALKIETRDLAPSDVPAVSRLHPDDGSFRATMSLPEGSTSNSAFLQLNDGFLLQELPFAVRLKQFRIEHYPNGQPKDFASDIEIVDGAKTVPVTLQVNHPFTYRGVTLFQSGFADGGTSVNLRLLPSDGSASVQQVEGKVGAGSALLIDGDPYTLEFTDLRAMNVFANDDTPAGTSWNSRNKPGEHMHDVGPSLSFRLRDKLGQANDWNIYMKPVAIDGASYFLIGYRVTQDDAMHYLRLPADVHGSLESYLRFASELGKKETRAKAARVVSLDVREPKLARALEASTEQLLDAFAARGFRAVADLVPASGSKEQQMKAGRLYLDLLERAAATIDGGDRRLVHDYLAAYGDAIEARLPVFFQMSSFHQVNASGLQVTRAPGAALVYLGSALLALGVIAMYFVRERRLWLRVGEGKLLVAFAANRHTPILQAEFDGHRAAINELIETTR